MMISSPEDKLGNFNRSKALLGATFVKLVEKVPAFKMASWKQLSRYYVDIYFQNDLAVKLNSGKPVSHTLAWFGFNLI